VFFDDLESSETYTYTEQVEHCPACGRRLERKTVIRAVNPAV
jgi:rRNA maturation endonuclease Nob1